LRPSGESASASEAERQARAQRIREASRVKIREILTLEQRARYDEMSAAAGTGRAGTAGRVWVAGPAGKPKAVTLTLGLRDGAATEILRGEVNEGQEVIVGLAGQSGTPARPGGSTGSGPRLRL
jgi:HlyD family secretion protein